MLCQLYSTNYVEYSFPTNYSIQPSPFIAVGVDYTLRFDKEKWDFTMFYIDRELATGMKEKIKKNVLASSKEQPDTKVKDIIFDKFR